MVVISVRNLSALVRFFTASQSPRLDQHQAASVNVACDKQAGEHPSVATIWLNWKNSDV